MIRLVLILGLCMAAGSVPGGAAGGKEGTRGVRAPEPPPQPTSGPGSSDYPHAGMVSFEVEAKADAYFVFEPTDPVPPSAPVIAFLHGFGATQPRSYIGWISHIVRRGNIVLYPVYQSNDRRSADTYTLHALTALVDAQRVLATFGDVRPDWAHFALAGHSLGGVIAANIAAAAEEAGLPPPRALMLANAGDSGTHPGSAFHSLLGDGNYGAIPPDILIVAVVGDEDRVVGDEAPRFIFAATPQIPSEHKQMLLLASDHHGVPPLEADHRAPGSIDLGLLLGQTPFPALADRTSNVDALDFFGYWKWFDALVEQAFFNFDGGYAFGSTPDATFMGLWSDGTPVNRAEVLWP